MRRLPLTFVLCAAAPAFAREVRGRVSHTGEGPKTLRKAAQGQSVLRVNLVTETGEVVTLNLQEGLTRVFEGARLTGTGSVRANARIKATVDDDCKLSSDLHRLAGRDRAGFGADPHRGGEGARRHRRRRARQGHEEQGPRDERAGRRARRRRGRRSGAARRQLPRRHGAVAERRAAHHR